MSVVEQVSSRVPSKIPAVYSEKDQPSDRHQWSLLAVGLLSTSLA